MRVLTHVSTSRRVLWWATAFAAVGVGWVALQQSMKGIPIWWAFAGVTLPAGVAWFRHSKSRISAGTSTFMDSHFSAIVEAAPDAIVMCDNQGKIVLFNGQAERWFGYRRDEVIGQSLEMLLPERVRGGHAGLRKGYIEKPVLRPMGTGRELYGLRKNGEEFPLEISLSPMKTSSGNYITSIIRDISERKRIEAERIEAEMRYQNLVNSLPVGIFRCNEKNELVDYNHAMKRILGILSFEDFRAVQITDFCLVPEEWRMFVEKKLVSGEMATVELAMKTQMGGVIDAELSVAKKIDDKGKLIIEGILQDISERKEGDRKVAMLNTALRAQFTKLQETNKELESFSYSVSHDLRSPLRAIDGFSRTLESEYSERIDERGRDRIKRIRAAAQRMAELIDDLLNLSRISRTELRFSSVNLSEIAEQVLDTLSQGDTRRRVEIKIQPELQVVSDARMLRTIMDNLIGNAWKFTSCREVAQIEVGKEMQGDEVVYFVRDNGAGFDMAYADKLFGAFQRLHDATEYPGNGIGLATVQRVIKKHGGRVWAESQRETGSTFYFTLGQGESL